MKGVIVTCFKQMVEKRFGAEKWTAVVAEAGVQGVDYPSPIVNIDDAAVLALVRSACKVLGVTAEQAADAFGEHWCCTFAPENYPSIIGRFKSTKEMLLGMDRVHRETTASIKDAHPPKFEYRWKGDKTLVMTYRSKRGLIDFAAGLARGVGRYFGEKITVRKVSSNEIEVDFP